MNFHNQHLGAIMTRTTEEKLKSIEKDLADKIYLEGSAWHELLVNLRDFYSKELKAKSKPA